MVSFNSLNLSWGWGGRWRRLLASVVETLSSNESHRVRMHNWTRPNIRYRPQSMAAHCYLNLNDASPSSADLSLFASNVKWLFHPPSHIIDHWCHFVMNLTCVACCTMCHEHRYNNDIYIHIFLIRYFYELVDIKKITNKVEGSNFYGVMYLIIIDTLVEMMSRILWGAQLGDDSFISFDFLFIAQQ